ncbi:MAG: GNAT family N-acetyltransferase [Rhodospirillales bacterium]|nr:GNAT family N-acetyltransferase [Rhodospirillales bacterium]
MTVEIIEDARALAPLRVDWNALAGPLAAPMVTYDWIQACASASEEAARLAIVVVRDGATVRGVAPLAIGRRNGIPTLEFVGEPVCHVNEPCDFLYADDDAFIALMTAVAAIGLPLRLDRLPINSPTVSLLTRCRGYLATPPKVTRAPFLPVAGSWDQFVAAWPKSRRRSVKRALRAAQDHGPVACEIVAPTPETAEAHIRDFLRIEGSGWKGRAGTAACLNPHSERFWRSYCLALAADGALRVSTLRIGSVAVAVQLGAEVARRYWALKIGHDEHYEDASPGFLLTHETLRDTFARGLTGYEFMGEDMPWKQRWTERTHEFASVRLYPASLTGIAGLGANAVCYTVTRAGRFARRYARRRA